MTIMVNGKPLAVPPATSAAALLQQCGYQAERVALEHNGAILPRARFADTLLAEGDRLEVVTFVGGG